MLAILLTLSQAKKPPAAAAPSAPSAAKKPAPAASGSKASKPSGAVPASESFKYKYNLEDAEARTADLIPSQIQSDLGDANWKPRLAALEEFTSWLENGEVDEIDSELVVRFLAKKGWNEKNFQVR